MRFIMTREEAERLPDQPLSTLLLKTAVLAVVLFGTVAGIMSVFTG